MWGMTCKQLILQENYSFILIEYVKFRAGRLENVDKTYPVFHIMGIHLSKKYLL
jgi:hypothetical protein